MNLSYKKILPYLASLSIASVAQADETVVTANTGDTAWLLVSTALVLFMTPGLAFFYAGMARTKNVVSTLFQNFAALGLIGILWAICGYTLAFGPTGNGIVGGMDYLFLNGVGDAPNSEYAATIPHSLFMLFQCMFAVITPILMSGTIAERIRFKSFLLFISLWSIFIYAPIAHWVWGVGGFIRNLGGLDFAGGMVVHMSAGFSALMALIMLKNRKGFGQTEMPAYDVGMVFLGTALLWFGWFGFNAGSALAANGLASQAFGNTFFASGAAFTTWMIVDSYRKGKPSAVGACVGAVAGLICITPAAGFVSFTSAIIMGILAGVICNLSVSAIKDKFKLDDSLDVIGCHGVGGLLGTVLTGVFASKSVNPAGADGLMSGSSDLLISNLIGAGTVVLISLIGTGIVFKITDMIFGMRVTEQEEEQGLDLSQHGEVINSNFAPHNNESHTIKKAS